MTDSTITRLNDVLLCSNVACFRLAEQYSELYSLRGVRARISSVNVQSQDRIVSASSRV